MRALILMEKYKDSHKLCKQSKDLNSSEMNGTVFGKMIYLHDNFMEKTLLISREKGWIFALSQSSNTAMSTCMLWQVLTGAKTIGERGSHLGLPD